VSALLFEEKIVFASVLKSDFFDDVAVLEVAFKLKVIPSTN
jgi:hypothetical protein